MYMYMGMGVLSCELKYTKDKITPEPRRRTNESKRKGRNQGRKEMGAWGAGRMSPRVHKHIEAAQGQPLKI